MNYLELYDAELYHYGVKGQQWGVRRYQYSDGTLTPAGKKRYSQNGNRNSDRIGRMLNQKVSYIVESNKTIITGRQYVDGYLKQGTTLARIQTKSEFENFAFYATYKKSDMDKYMGLFGKNLTTRANNDATRAEKNAQKTGDQNDIESAKVMRDYANNLKVYQLKLESTRKLKIPSDKNAADITVKLLKEKDFKDDLQYSIDHAKELMKRPQQQMLFKQAQNVLRKDPAKMTDSEKIAVYKAFNLSLVNHDSREIAAQNRFYSEMKKKGYNALLDYNDKDFSSYHAKRPMIVFDTESVKLQAVVETNPKVVDKLYKRYNAERVSKEAIANTLGLVTRMGTKTISDCDSYLQSKMDSYLTGGKSKSQIIREYKKKHPNTQLTNTQIVNNHQS